MRKGCGGPARPWRISLLPFACGLRPSGDHKSASSVKARISSSRLPRARAAAYLSSTLLTARSSTGDAAAELVVGRTDTVAAIRAAMIGKHREVAGMAASWHPGQGMRNRQPSEPRWLRPLSSRLACCASDRHGRIAEQPLLIMSGRLGQRRQVLRLCLLPLTSATHRRPASGRAKRRAAGRRRR